MINVQTTDIDIDIDTLAGNATVSSLAGSLTIGGNLTVSGTSSIGSLNLASPAMSGTITLANNTAFKGDFGVLANRPYFQSNTGHITVLETLGADTSTSSSATYSARSSSDWANGNVVQVSTATTATLNTGGCAISWGARIAGVNTNPTKNNALNIKGLAGKVYAAFEVGGFNVLDDAVGGSSIFSFQTQTPSGFVNANLWSGIGDGTSANGCNFVVQTRPFAAVDQHWIQIAGANGGSASPTSGDSLNIGAGRNGTGGSLSIIPLTITNDGGAAHGDGSQITLQPAAEIDFSATSGMQWMTSTPAATTFIGGQAVFPQYAKASLPTAVALGAHIFVTDSVPVAPAFWNGTSWINYLTGLAVV